MTFILFYIILSLVLSVMGVPGTLFVVAGSVDGVVGGSSTFLQRLV